MKIDEILKLAEEFETQTNEQAIEANNRQYLSQANQACLSALSKLDIYDNAYGDVYQIAGFLSNLTSSYSELKVKSDADKIRQMLQSAIEKIPQGPARSDLMRTKRFMDAVV